MLYHNYTTLKFVYLLIIKLFDIDIIAKMYQKLTALMLNG